MGFIVVWKLGNGVYCGVWKLGNGVYCGVWKLGNGVYCGVWKLFNRFITQHRVNSYSVYSCTVYTVHYTLKYTCCRLQTAGLGGLRPNTILMGWPDNWRSKNSYENFSRVVRYLSVVYYLYIPVYISM